MTGNYIGNNPNGLDIVLSDSYETNKSQLIASTKCVNNVYNNLKELIDSKGEGGGLPLGHIYLWPFSTPQDGSIQVNGDTYSRTLYSDLWALIQEKGWYKPESEWQQIASANNGYCPWYSNGDGSTTFRTPKFAPYQKLAIASGDAGKYYEAGLPGITGDLEAQGTSGGRSVGNISSNSPTFKVSQIGTIDAGTSGASTYQQRASFDASRSNPIYGNSTTVQPESHDWIVCVVAFGSATNVGSVDVANVISAVSQVQANPNLHGTAHIVETWKSTDGTSWYRIWSDEWIEQGSIAPIGSTSVTFLKSFSDTNYYFNANLDGSISGTVHIISGPYSTTGCTLKEGQYNTSPRALSSTAKWYACGY